MNNKGFQLSPTTLIRMERLKKERQYDVTRRKVHFKSPQELRKAVMLKSFKKKVNSPVKKIRNNGKVSKLTPKKKLKKVKVISKKIKFKKGKTRKKLVKKYVPKDDKEKNEYIKTIKDGKFKKSKCNGCKKKEYYLKYLITENKNLENTITKKTTENDKEFERMCVKLEDQFKSIQDLEEENKKLKEDNEKILQSKLLLSTFTPQKPETEEILSEKLDKVINSRLDKVLSEKVFNVVHGDTDNEGGTDDLKRTSTRVFHIKGHNDSDKKSQDIFSKKIDEVISDRVFHIIESDEEKGYSDDDDHDHEEESQLKNTELIPTDEDIILSCENYFSDNINSPLIHRNEKRVRKYREHFLSDDDELEMRDDDDNDDEDEVNDENFIDDEDNNNDNETNNNNQQQQQEKIKENNPEGLFSPRRNKKESNKSIEDYVNEINKTNNILEKDLKDLTIEELDDLSREDLNKFDFSEFDEVDRILTPQIFKKVNRKLDFSKCESEINWWQKLYVIFRAFQANIFNFKVCSNACE